MLLFGDSSPVTYSVSGCEISCYLGVERWAVFLDMVVKTREDGLLSFFTC